MSMSRLAFLDLYSHRNRMLASWFLRVLLYSPCFLCLFFSPFQIFHDLIELRMEEIRAAARLEAGSPGSEGDEDGHGMPV